MLVTRPIEELFAGSDDERPLVFLSYSHADREHPLYRQLTIDLDSTPGIQYWVDEQRVGPGERLIEALARPIARADFFVAVLSENSAKSPWAMQEFFLAYSDQLARQDLKIIFVRIDRVELPPRARSAEVIDLTEDYEGGVSKLVSIILESRNPSIATFDLDLSINQQTIVTVSSVISDRLADYFSHHPEELTRIDRRKFEELVAELFDRFGYDVELTKKTRDGGRDVIAIKNREAEVKYLIECKKPDPGGYVGVKPVRELLGVKYDEKATKAILATTAYFSSDALLYFERNRWELEPRDYDGVLRWLKQYRTTKASTGQ